MNVKRKTRIFFMVIFAITAVVTIIGVKAAPSFQTAHIIQTEDDEFITEVGIGFDSTLTTILDPNMDIRARLHFRGIDINPWEFLDNATLILTSASTLAFDNESTVQVRGIKVADLQGLSGDAQYGISTWLNFPLTIAFVDVNTSQFFGGATLEINVTEIIEELIRDPAWDGDGPASALPGDDIAFMIRGLQGHDTRYFYDFRGDPARSADLVLHWGSAPPPPPGGGEFNETNRDFNIWFVEGNGPNRTGTGDDLNWNTVNMTELSEKDGGGDLFLHNDTWVTFTSITKSVVDSMYADNGAANITSFFARFYINTTAVTNTIAGTDPVTSLVGLSTNIPTTSAGLAYGVAGDWIGLVVILNVDDQRWRVWVRDRTGAAAALGANSINFWEDWPDLLYFEVKINITNSFVRYSIYNDAEYTDLNQTEDYVIVNAAGPFRYPQLIASVGQAGASTHSGEYYTFLENPLAENITWIVTYPNGTIIDDTLDTYDDALTLIDTILGPDPTDPDPPSQGWDTEGPFTRFKTRFYIFVLGVGLLWGPVMVYAWRRPTGHEFIVGILLMTLGLGLLIHAGTV